MPKRVGITSMGFYFPRSYVSIPELLEARGESPDKADKGLGIDRMAILASNEDSVTMAANAIETLKLRKENVGKLIFATECGTDSAKDNAAYIHELCGLPKNCEAYDVKAACAAGTYALWQVIDWILSGRAKGKLGLVVCSDQAIYEHGTGAEITGGAGAIAFLIGQDPQIISFDLESGNYKNNVRDFWKPLACDCAIIAGDGKLSIESYLNGIKPSFYDFIENGGNNSFDHLVFHTPYTNMVCKAFKELSKAIPSIKGKYEIMTDNSLKASRMVGNIYNGSLYLALASLLELMGSSAQGKSVGFYSFGSGCSSKFFRGIVNAECDGALGLFEQLGGMEKISAAEYENIRQGKTTMKETKGFLLNGIDKQSYRQYIRK
jgi:hydroxymethylglutaryl-CoA synthase